MTIKTIRLEEARYNDLMKFAKSRDLEITRGLDAAGLLSLIKTAFPTLESIDIEVADVADAPEESAPEAPKLSTHYRDDPKVTVVVQSDEATGKHHLPLCVNEDHILVQRDIPVAIPYRHYLALLNMVESVQTQVFDPVNMKYNVVSHNRKAINFSVSDLPSAAEIAAWEKRTANIGRGDEVKPQRQELQNLVGLLSAAAA